MIRTLRAFFLSRLLREKLLVVAFLGIAVVMWGSSISSRVTRFWRAERRTTEELKQQAGMLGRRAEVEAAAHNAAARLDPAKTLDPTRLFAAVQQMAADAGIKNPTIANPQVAPFDQFSLNTVRVQLMNADWNAFRSFYQAIQARAPYMAIADIALAPARGNPAEVMATMAISSVEIKR